MSLSFVGVYDKVTKTHTPKCGYGERVCECKEKAHKCVFNLEIDEIMTFTSYQIFSTGKKEELLKMRGTQGVLYNLKDDGTEVRHISHDGRYCADSSQFGGDCTRPQYVDGKTYRMAIGVNGQIPGPTIIVHEGQSVVIHVHNNLTTEGGSVYCESYSET